MTSPDRLLNDFVDAWSAGERPRVEDYLERAPEGDRDELALLINAFLEEAPQPKYSAETLAQIQAEPAVAELSALIDSQAGFWPSLLPRLRERAELTRDEVVKRLAQALALEGREDRIKPYYHQMESGTIDPAGVSRKVLEALSRIFGVELSEIEEAGDFAGLGAAVPTSAYMRSETVLESRAHAYDELPAAGAGDPGPWDEVDELFRGGR